ESLQLYQGTTGSPSDLAGAGTKVYDLDATGGGNTLLMKDLSHGSGEPDYVIDVPTAKYNATGDYVTLYAKFSDADAGFEEFGAAQDAAPPPPPSIDIAKTTVDDTANGDDLKILAGRTIHLPLAVHH